MMSQTTIDPVQGLDDLRARVTAGETEFAILLAGGLAYSRKTIRRSKGRWHIRNHIDDTVQRLTDEELWTLSNIGPALDLGGLAAATASSRVGRRRSDHHPDEADRGQNDHYLPHHGIYSSSQSVHRARTPCACSPTNKLTGGKEVREPPQTVLKGWRSRARNINDLS